MFIKIKYLYSPMPVRKCTNNSNYVRSRDHFWIPHQLFHGQSGRSWQQARRSFISSDCWGIKCNKPNGRLFSLFLSCLPTLASISTKGHSGDDRKRGYYKVKAFAKMKKSWVAPFTTELVIVSSPSKFQNHAININELTNILYVSFC